jgi:energy-coupling factor transporter ATP-binding protein EcfA2
MYIKKLSLYNIRGYERNDIEFSKGINVLTGPNNAGKTTILKCLTILQSSRQNPAHEDIRRTKEFGRVLIELDDLSNETVNRIELNKFTQDDIKVSIGNQLIISYSLYNNGSGQQDEKLCAYKSWIQDISIDGRMKMYPEPEKNIKHFPNFKPFSNSETDGNFIYPFLARRKANYYNNNNRTDAYIIGDDLSSLPAKINKLAQRTHPMNKEFSRYCMELLGFEPGIVSMSIGDRTEERLGIYITNDKVVPLENMGEGVASILGILSILFTEDNKLFLIEELENDIHPKALKKLLDLIIEKSNKNQFVISTHSNIVVKYLCSAEHSKLFYTELKLKNVSFNNQSIILPTSIIKEISNDPKDRIKVLEDLGYDFFDFEIYKYYLILEESSAESLIKNFLIPQFTPSLNIQLKTIAASGADDLKARFHDFQRLFVFIHTTQIYHNRAWVIADGDTAGKRNIHELKARYKSWDKDNFINLSRSNIEDYYPVQFQDEVAEIFAIKDKTQKKKAKENLIKTVISWCSNDPQTAKQEFKDSASEIISLLEKIENIAQKSNG